MVADTSTAIVGSSSGSSSCCMMFGRKMPIHPSSAKFIDNAGAATAVSPPKLTDDAVMLAKELNELSFEEREKVFADIHGVTESVQETPEFIDSCIQELDAALAGLPRSKRQTLDRATFLKPSIEKDTKFKLMFLRVDDYDATKAARRMAKYFEHKAKVFGEDKLVQKITLADLNEHDLELFQSGPYITVPQKDAVGRPIWISNVPKFDFRHPGSQLRCAWYVIMSSLEDEAAQTMGICNLLYAPSNMKFSVPIHQALSTMMKDGEIVENLPIKMVGHFCYDSATMEFVLSAFRRAIGRKNRLRLRAHYGSGIEIQYKLRTYGIKLPFLLADYSDSDGCDKKMDVHKQFMQERLRQEQEEKQEQEQLYQDSINADKASTIIISYPNANDVLVGRGSPYQTYSGNIMLGEVIDEQFLKRYSQATEKFEKALLHIDVVKTLQEVHGSRFLERTSEGWKVVDDLTARKKVNSAFRSKMAKFATTLSNNESKNQSTTSSGKKTRQPSTTRNLGYFQMAFGGFAGGSTKRARYDPSQGNPHGI